MNNKYKTIPFSEVKIGQEFEMLMDDSKMTDEPWVKTSELTFNTEVNPYQRTSVQPSTPCLVRTANCEELDFDTWWEDQANNSLELRTPKQLMRAAWNAAKAK